MHMTHNELGGKRAVVTGAASGIGRASALLLARAGAQVVLLDAADLGEAREAVAAHGGAVTAHKVDVTDRRAVGATMRAAAGDEKTIDVLVTSAGVYGTPTSIDDLDEDNLRQVFDVNVNGTVWSAQAALPYMRSAGGSVVCLGSAAGKLGGLIAGSPYIMSKGAVHAFVKFLARTEAGNGIRANAIAAGAVKTPMTAGQDYPPSYCPLNRMAEAEEIAAAVLFLASPSSSYVTGTVMDVSGGYVMN
jgi:3-oxoacyl-[acyl-carrier protein] reductase